MYVHIGQLQHELLLSDTNACTWHQHLWAGPISLLGCVVCHCLLDMKQSVQTLPSWILKSALYHTKHL